MNKYDFTSMVKDPGKLGSNDVEALKLLVAEFPYFAIGQNLLVKALHNTKHYEYDKYLKQAALQAGNRAVLYNLVNDLPPETESVAMPLTATPGLPVHAPKPTQPAEPAKPAETGMVTKAELPVVEPETTLKPEPVADNEQLIADIAAPEAKVETPLTPPVIANEPGPVVESSQKKEEAPVKPLSYQEQLEQTPRFIIPEPEAEPEVEQYFHKKSGEIESGEKLVESTGNFVRYIPKNPPPPTPQKKEESLLTFSGDDDDKILRHFDISSLEDISVDDAKEVAPGKNVLNEQNGNEPLRTEPTPVENTSELPEPTIPADTNKEEQFIIAEPKVEPKADESSKQPALSLEHMLDGLSEDAFFGKEQAPPVNQPEAISGADNPLSDSSEDTREPAPETVAAKTATDNTSDADFLNWLNKKHKVEEEIVEPVADKKSSSEPVLPKTEESLLHIQRAEDLQFIERLESKLADESLSRIKEEIAAVLASETAPVAAEEELQEQVLSAEDVAAPLDEEFAAFDFFTQLKAGSSPGGNPLLKSLATYEVNEFLAPLYTQVSYNPQLFEKPFHAVFGGKTVAGKTHGSTQPYVILDEPVQEKPAQKAAPQAEPVVRPKLTDQPAPKIQRDPHVAESILDRFIRENPTIARPKSEFYSPLNMARQSAENNEEIVSETLANIYARQSLYKKAISMYEKLGLLYPEKLTYFAGLINEIKTTHNID